MIPLGEGEGCGVAEEVLDDVGEAASEVPDGDGEGNAELGDDDKGEGIGEMVEDEVKDGSLLVTEVIVVALDVVDVVEDVYREAGPGPGERGSMDMGPWRASCARAGSAAAINGMR